MIYCMVNVCFAVKIKADELLVVLDEEYDVRDCYLSHCRGDFNSCVTAGCKCWWLGCRTSRASTQVPRPCYFVCLDMHIYCSTPVILYVATSSPAPELRNKVMIAVDGWWKRLTDVDYPEKLDRHYWTHYTHSDQVFKGCPQRKQFQGDGDMLRTEQHLQSTS